MQRYLTTIMATAILLNLSAAPSWCQNGDPSHHCVKGIKGLWWKGMDNYEKALPWISAHRMNFLMFCYTSFPASATNWRSEYTPKEMNQFREMAIHADELNVTLCLSFNPSIWSNPPLVYSSDVDYQIVWNKVKNLHHLGIHWFALCLDDINRELQPADAIEYGTLQDAQVAFVNRLWRDMKTLSPRPTLLFCPSAYTTEDARIHLDYIKTIGAGVDPNVMMFWTGNTVRSPSICAEDAKTFGSWIKRKPFVWDNYPVNDAVPWRPQLGPFKGRSADLLGATSGYLANPMKQWALSQLPLATLADYLSEPKEYDPQTAINNAINAFPSNQREAIGALVALYGDTFIGEPNYPQKPLKSTREAALHQLSEYLRLKALLTKTPGLHEYWIEVAPTLEEDIKDLRRWSMDRLKESPLKAMGDDFEGGAGSIYGYKYFGHTVNYVYSKATAQNRMTVEFLIGNMPTSRGQLILVARDDETAKKPKIRLLLNEHIILDGDSPFSSSKFTTKKFAIPQGVLKQGVNTLAIENLEQTGVLGMPPWFMVTEARLLPGG